MPSALRFCIALLLASVSYVHPLAQSGTVGCDLLRLAPCLPFAGGAVAAPSDACCDSLGGVLRDQPACVCQAMDQSIALPVNVNRSLVLELPRLCHLDVAADAGLCARAPLPPSSSPPLSGLHPSANPSAQSVLAPSSPRISSHMLGKSWGFKLRVDGLSVALGFVALVSALAI